MNSTVTVPWFLVFAIFLFGVAVGWIAAHVRVTGRVNAGLRGVDLLQAGGFGLKTSGFVKRTTVRRMVLKCQCGAVWEFRDGAGSPPLLTGDSFVCPKCGRSIDLKLERRLEAEMLEGNANPQNKN